MKRLGGYGAALTALALLAGCATLLLNRAPPQLNGEIAGLPVEARVDVLRDSHGIPHIFASSERDLWTAQGFVHAQDRMWQMEILRRLTDGRLSEIAGRRTAATDVFCRLLGLADMKRRMLADLSPRELSALEAYSQGVNAYLRMRGGDLPVEFSSLGYVPEPWKPVDSLSFLALLSWEMVFGHYTEEVLALARGASFTEAEWNDAFPSWPDTELPRETFFEGQSRLSLGKIIPAALSFHVGLNDKDSPDALQKRLFSQASPGGGSNNWVVAKSADGMPLLANDPHLGVTLPATWYMCHVSCPGLNAAGVSVAGTPGIVLGRNEHVAWGATNTMIDGVDTVLFRVDPADPRRYVVGSRTLQMEKEDIVLRLPKGQSVRIPLYRTAAGPVITSVEPGIQAVAALQWYGTLPEGMIHDHTARAMFAGLKAGTAEEILDQGRDWAYAGMNLVAADDQGTIGWHVTGAVPIRAGYSGRLPADGSAGDRWTGFVSYDDLPRSLNPWQGWIATANQKPDAPWSVPLSYLWAAPYRHQRISELLSGMPGPRVEDFQRLQMDVHSLQADRLVPKVLAYSFADARARKAAALLSAWDRELTRESAAAAVFEVFLTSLDRQLLGPRLGVDLPLYFNCRSYGIEDEILDRPSSPLWKGNPRAVIERALAEAWAFCSARMGADERQWRWSRIHAYHFNHPGATDALSSFLLNRGPYPAGGDNNTVNAAYYVPARDSYDVIWIPSMRMIAAPGQRDGLWIAGPLGQSGQAASAHYDDMMDEWQTGSLLEVPLSRTGAERAARDVLALVP